MDVLIRSAVGPQVSCWSRVRSVNFRVLEVYILLSIIYLFITISDHLLRIPISTYPADFQSQLIMIPRYWITWDLASVMKELDTAPPIQTRMYQDRRTKAAPIEVWKCFASEMIICHHLPMFALWIHCHILPPSERVSGFFFLRHLDVGEL